MSSGESLKIMGDKSRSRLKKEALVAMWKRAQRQAGWPDGRP